MFDLTALIDAVVRHDRVARVTLASVKGSCPRETGAAMLVWAAGQSGSIGGGQLEYQAIADARAHLGKSETLVRRAALGPQMNQCCGGAVTLVTEVFDAAALARIDGTGFARRVEGTSSQPDHMRRSLQRAAAQGRPAPHLFASGWLLEPLAMDQLPVVIYGAGHVGAALAAVLSPLPEVSVTLADDRDEFSGIGGIVPIADAIAQAPPLASHFVMTHAHDLDLQICHALLSRPTGAIGLIGSATKWARFRRRLGALGHNPETVDKIICPIGEPSLGKHPQAIALGVATDLLRLVKTPRNQREAG